MTQRQFSERRRWPRLDVRHGRLSSIFRFRYRSSSAQQPPARRRAHRSGALPTDPAARAPPPGADERRGRTLARHPAPAAGAVDVGGAVGHDVVPLPRRRARRVGVAARRGDRRPRICRRQSRFPVRGPRARRAGRTAAGHPPAAHSGTGRSRWRPGQPDHRGGLEPDVPAVPTVTAGLALDGGRGAAVRVHPCRPRRRRRRGRGDAPRLQSAQQRHAHAGCHRPAAAAVAPGARPRPRCARRRSDACRSTSDPRPGAIDVDRRTGAHGHRHGPRAHRHGVAVADARDRPQVRSHVRLGGGADGRRARLRVLLLAGPAVRVGARARARPLRPDRRQGRRRPVGAGRGDVGRGRHEPPVGREHRPPDRSRSALVRGALRRDVHGGVDPRCVRVPGQPAAGVRRRRDAPLRDPEVVVEPHQSVPPPDVLVGGHRRQPGAHALPARRHVRRRDHPGRAQRVDGAVHRARLEQLLVGPVRLWRRWWGADPGDAGAGCAPRRPRPDAARRARFGGAVLRPRRGRGGRRRTGPGVAR